MSSKEPKMKLVGWGPGTYRIVAKNLLRTNETKRRSTMAARATLKKSQLTEGVIETRADTRRIPSMTKYIIVHMLGPCVVRVTSLM